MSVAHVVDTVEKLVNAGKSAAGESSIVIVISTYVIGKEPILLAVRHLTFRVELKFSV